MSRRLFSIIFALVISVTGCRQEADVTATAPDPSTDTAATQTTDTAAQQQPIVLEGFSTPECALYDAEQDVYFVSNINGSPLDADDNGFISRVNAETRQVEAKWIDGAAQNVSLGAPKGMAIVGDELWVTDINRIAKFDRKTGQPKGTFNIAGATFLNDLATDGTAVYASDTGMKSDGKGGFTPTGTDAVYEVTGSKAKKIAAAKDLNRPNGLAVSGGKVWVATFGAAELFPLDGGKKGSVATLPAGSLDGLLVLDDGSFLVSSWDGKSVFRGTSGAAFQPVIQNVDSPADLGFDSKRRLVLVPHFMENRVTLHALR